MLKKSHILFIGILLVSNFALAQTNSLQLTAGIQYNGLPVNPHIRLLESTVEITHILEEHHKTIYDLDFRDFKVAATTFFLRDNLKELADTHGATFSVGTSLGQAFNRVLYTSSNVQNVRGISPYALEVTGMFKVGPKSYLTLRTEYATSEYGFFKDRMTRSVRKAAESKESISNGNSLFHLEPNVIETYGQPLTESSIDDTVIQTIHDNPTFCDQYSCTVATIPTSDHQRSQSFNFSCGIEEQRFSLRFDFERFTVGRIANAYRIDDTGTHSGNFSSGYTLPDNISSVLVIDTRRKQDTFSVNAEMKILEFGRSNLCLTAGVDHIQNTYSFEQSSQSYRGHYIPKPGGGTRFEYSNDFPEIDPIYAQVDQRLKDANPKEKFTMFRVGVAVYLNQRNNRGDVRLARIKAKEAEVEKAKQELYLSVQKAMMILDEAERKARSAQTIRESYNIWVKARDLANEYITESPGIELLDYEFIEDATCFVRELIESTKEEE